MCPAAAAIAASAMNTPDSGAVRRSASDKALITGGARRIGRAIAVGLARRGYSLALHWHEAEPDARDAVQECLVAGAPAAVALQADLARPDDRDSLVDRAAESLEGSLSLLVNNASSFARDDLAGSRRDASERNLAVGLTAPFVLTRSFAGQAVSARECNIINLLDSDLFRPGRDFASYRLAKAGLARLTEDAALALAPRIRVNAIAPGPVLPSTNQSTEHFERSRLRAPLERHASPEEIVHTVFHILACPSMTGAIIPLDGGRRLVGPDAIQ